MRRSLLALLACAPLAMAQSQTYTYSYGGFPLTIYPNDWNVITVVRIAVPKSISISKVTASVQVQYSGVGDLNVFLYSAAGTRTKLLERNCGSLLNINTTFDDSAPTRFGGACPSTAGGSYQGNEPLANANGQNAFGYWRLAVENNGSGKTGLVTGFSVTVTGTPLGPPVIGPNTIFSTSSFQSGGAAPGDQISLLGVNLGPTTGVRADATQTLPTSLGGTTVTFNGTSASMYYASDSLLSVQAPTGLTPGSVAQVQVVSSSGSSANIPVTVYSTNPGIFTYDAGGQGQARALNQDGTANGDGSNIGSDVPAAAGSIISIFATGLGPVDPAIPQGAPAPLNKLSNLTLPYSVSIGGRNANVTFAGAAPGLIGTYQLNVAVPVGTPSGSNRLVVTVAGNNSQAGVTIQVR